ncbi:hypothetical protein ANAPRD1_00449 [Anaplasma phagocytophilum]|nr:hypothetical protein ANAPRD1_00449 [Anaplasma phagocytophilum]
MYNKQLMRSMYEKDKVVFMLIISVSIDIFIPNFYMKNRKVI